MKRLRHRRMKTCLGPISLTGGIADESCLTSWLRHPYPEATNLLRVSQAQLPELYTPSSQEMRCMMTMRSTMWIWAAKDWKVDIVR